MVSAAARGGGPKLRNEFKYRWRLVQAGSPLRTQRIGDFEVTLLAESVGAVTYTGQPATWSAYGTYTITIGNRLNTVLATGMLDQHFDQ